MAFLNYKNSKLDLKLSYEWNAAAASNSIHLTPELKEAASQGDGKVVLQSVVALPQYQAVGLV